MDAEIRVERADAPMEGMVVPRIAVSLELLFNTRTGNESVTKQTAWPKSAVARHHERLR